MKRKDEEGSSSTFLRVPSMRANITLILSKLSSKLRTPQLKITPIKIQDSDLTGIEPIGFIIFSIIILLKALCAFRSEIFVKMNVRLLKFPSHENETHLPT